MHFVLMTGGEWTYRKDDVRISKVMYRCKEDGCDYYLDAQVYITQHGPNGVGTSVGVSRPTAPNGSLGFFRPGANPKAGVFDSFRAWFTQRLKEGNFDIPLGMDIELLEETVTVEKANYSVLLKHDHDHEYKPADAERAALGEIKVNLDSFNFAFRSPPEYIQVDIRAVRGCSLCNRPLLEGQSVTRFGIAASRITYHRSCFDSATIRETL